MATVATRQQLRAYGVERVGGQQRVAVLGDAHRVDDDGRVRVRRAARRPSRRVRREASIPVLTACTPMSSTTLRYWARTASAGSSQAPCTPREFCAVTAVTHAHAVHAERQHRLQVGLDAGAAAGVGPGDGEHTRGGRRGGHAPTLLAVLDVPEVVPAALAGPGRAVDGHLGQRRTG